MTNAGASHQLLAHVHTVAALSYQSALWIRANLHAVDPLLAHRGGIVHDLAKVAASRTGDHKIDHGEMAAEILYNKNQPALAEIARRHLLFRPLENSRKPETIEQKLVFFMDKLVESSRLVTLEERLQHLHQRYQLDQEQIKALKPYLYDIQSELCELAGISPRDLLPLLKEAIF